MEAAQPRTDLDPATETIPRSEGSHLSVTDWGGSGPPCLFVHGMGHHSRLWDDAATVARTAGYRPVAVDLPGHGRSSWSSDYDLLSLAAAVVTFVQRYATERPVLVGHSLGGDLCLRYAAVHPVRALVLVDSGPEPNLEGVVHVKQTEAEAPVSFADHQAATDYFRQVHPMADEEALSRLVRHGLIAGSLDRARDPAFGWPYTSITETAADRWARLSRVSAPTLVVRGQGSAVLPAATAQRMADHLADGRVAVVRGAGHAVMLDNPAGFNDAFGSFLSLLPKG